MPTTTLYCRNDSWTVNGVSAYKLDTTNTSSSTYTEIFASGQIPACVSVRGDFDVYELYILHADSSTTIIGSGAATNHVAHLQIIEGMEYPTIAISTTIMSPTDALYLILRTEFNVQPSSYTYAYFVSKQLGWGSINATTLTMSRYWYVLHGCSGGPYPPNPITNTGRVRLYWGDSSHATGISGVDYSEGGSNSVLFGADF